MDSLYWPPYWVLVALVVVLSLLCAFLAWHAKMITREVFLDALTQVGNRRFYERQAAMAVSHALRAGEPVGLLVVDLNHLKRVNDTHGHRAGDRVIRAVADALRESVRPTDCVARVGGDEFFVLLPACAPDKLDVVVRRIHQNLLVAAIPFKDAHLAVRVSIGGTRLCVRDGRVYVGGVDIGLARAHSVREQAAHVLVETADVAMYEAKSRKDAEDLPVTLR